MKRAAIALGLFIAAMTPVANETNKNPRDDRLEWRSDGTASVQIEQWPLEKVLQSLSDQGRWEILVEPDLQLKVTTRFKDLRHPEALRRLLSEVNFAIIPTPGSPSKMLVYKPASTRAVIRIIPTRRLPKRQPDGDKEVDSPKIPNELIVTLKPNTGIDIAELSKKIGKTKALPLLTTTLA